jgi:Protein of unknown function (DUF3157)
MKRPSFSGAAGILIVFGISLVPALAADIEVTGPDGRRILLKDDGTWRYVQTKEKEASKDKSEAKDKSKEKAQAVLRLERKTALGNSCRYGLRLDNNLPYEIRSLVPSFSAYRQNGVVYDKVLSAFQAIKPGDSQVREIDFRGIPCDEIARVHVQDGDRCVMGDLDRFSYETGVCLERVRVVASDLVRFDKDAKSDKETKGDKDAKRDKEAKEDKEAKGK